ncbi:MAG: hypothetical protein R3277_03035, partial [Brumimicrobium sp.]|nr:hypothetical protein [Brumimicrobium sp.]
MNRFAWRIIGFLLVAFCSSPVFAQQADDQVDERWKQMEERIDYGPPGSKKGPSNNYISPPELQSQPSGVGKKSTTGQPSDDQILYSREKLYDNSTGKGFEKKIKKSEQEGLEDMDTPESEAPTLGSPDWDAPDFSAGDAQFWKILVIIIAILLLAYIVYQLFIKTKSAKDTSVAPVDYSLEDLDPRKVKRSQLEIDLDKALAAEDYRLAVRIYYTMLLKALVEKEFIRWEKKKTNISYLMEMKD